MSIIYDCGCEQRADGSLERQCVLHTAIDQLHQKLDAAQAREKALLDEVLAWRQGWDAACPQASVKWLREARDRRAATDAALGDGV